MSGIIAEITPFDPCRFATLSPTCAGDSYLTLILPKVLSKTESTTTPGVT